MADDNPIPAIFHFPPFHFLESDELNISVFYVLKKDVAF